MFTSVICALIGLVSLTHANPRTAERFERRLRHYFSQFADGEDVIGEIRFTNEVRLDLEYHVAKTWPQRASDDPDDHIPFEIAYFRAFDRILCRVGIGAGATPAEFHILPVVQAQCVPMTGQQLTYGVPDLAEGYRAARAVFHEPARNPLIAQPMPAVKLRAFDQRQLPPIVEARMLFFLTRSIALTNPVFTVSARTRTYATLLDGETRERDYRTPMWTFSSRDEGARRVEDRSCAPALFNPQTFLTRDGGGRSII